MKKDMPLEGLRWSRDSGSALYDTPQTAVLGRAGGGVETGRSKAPDMAKKNANTRHREVAQRRKENTTTLTRRNWRVHQHNHHTS